MATGNTSKFWTYLLIAAGVAAGVLVIGYFVFPDLIKQLTQWVVGLMLVVTGLAFRKKR